MTTHNNGNNIAALADDFGKLKAAIADLEAKVAELRTAIMEAGEDTIEGKLFKIMVIRSSRSQLDLDAVRAKLPEKWLAAHTKHIDVTSVRVSAR